MTTLKIENNGPDIIASNYWQSEYARAGKLIVSCNAGAIRLLIPPQMRPALNAMRSAVYVIISRGPWPEVGAAEAVEILFEDHTDSPWTAHLTPESFFNGLPSQPPAGKAWRVSVWDYKKGKPEKAIDLPCRWRRVASLPCLRPWSEK